MSAHDSKKLRFGRRITPLSNCGFWVSGLFLILSSISLAQEPAGPVVKVMGGQVQGQFLPAPGGAVFKGIPYAAQPIGDLRWKETQPLKPWSGVLKATEFRNGCGLVPKGTDAANINPEDCLYVNVWAPEWPSTTKKAVMVWITGGELFGGSGALAPGSESLARHGVVLVGVNYRGGPLSMMGHPELTAESPHHSSGNYMIYDIVAALKWIHDNIAQFGGDPGNVTVFGQSGGARMTSFLLRRRLPRV
jgi:para-nitrobenzyl esterase